MSNVAKLIQNLSKSEVQTIEAKLTELKGKRKTLESKYDDLSDRITQQAGAFDVARSRARETRAALDASREAHAETLEEQFSRQQKTLMAELEGDRSSSERYVRAVTEYVAKFDRLDKEHEALALELEVAKQAFESAQEEFKKVVKTSMRPLLKEWRDLDERLEALRKEHEGTIAGYSKPPQTPQNRAKLEEEQDKYEKKRGELMSDLEKAKGERYEQVCQLLSAPRQKEDQARQAMKQKDSLCRDKREELLRLNESMERTSAPFLKTLSPKERADRLEKKKQRQAAATKAQETQKAAAAAAAKAAEKAQQDVDAGAAAILATWSEMQKLVETQLVPLDREINKLDADRDKLLKS